MPFKSQKQSRAAFGGYLGPEMKAKAKEWADKTDYSKLKEDEISEDELSEVSPPGMKHMTHSSDARKNFGKEYGDRGKSVLYATAWKDKEKNESYMLTASLLECIRCKNWHEANILVERILIGKANARTNDIKTRVFMEDEKRCELCGSTKNVKMVDHTPLCAKCDPESDVDESETFTMGQVDSDRDGKISADKQGPEDVMNVKKGDKQLTPGWKSNGLRSEGVWSDEAGEQHVAGGASGTDPESEIQADKQEPEDVMNVKKGDKQLTPGWKSNGLRTENDQPANLPVTPRMKALHSEMDDANVGPGDETNSMERGDGTHTGGPMENELPPWLAKFKKK